MKKTAKLILFTIVVIGLLSIPGYLFAIPNEITSPQENEIVCGTLDLAATYDDENDDKDSVQWAVRFNTSAQNTNTRIGNVDGYNDAFSWDGESFSASFDVSGLAGGKYYFVFNPREDAGAQDIRLVRGFYIVDKCVYGGGHILQENGDKRKDWYDISFGGLVGSASSEGYMGEWQIVFHNVRDDSLDKAKFHSTNITVMNFFAPTVSCNGAVNFTIEGTLNGESGYKVIFRAGDEPDTVRIELYQGSSKIFDSSDTAGGDFTSSSNCWGTARTTLDNGNITIVQ